MNITLVLNNDEDVAAALTMLNVLNVFNKHKQHAAQKVFPAGPPASAWKFPDNLDLPREPELPTAPNVPEDEILPETQLAAKPKAVARARTGFTWTPERDALVAAHTGRPCELKNLLPQLNEMSGDEIKTPKSVEARYHKLKCDFLLDSQGTKTRIITPSAQLVQPAIAETLKPPVAMPAAVSAPATILCKAPASPPPLATKKTSSIPEPVSLRHAERWAGERGLFNGREKLDLEKVNARRQHLGQRPFEIIQPSR